MFQLKPISSEAIPRALGKAERYRLLNEPQEAESICQDILAVDPDNQQALVMLLLSITDQFGGGSRRGAGEARTVLARLKGEYDRYYYGGLISERWFKGQLHDGTHASLTTGWVLEAMDAYEKARALSPAGNEDAVLRWNACVRLLERRPELMAGMETGGSEGFGDERPR